MANILNRSEPTARRIPDAELVICDNTAHGGIFQRHAQMRAESPGFPCRLI